jgi:hypothetical protein
MSKYKSIIKKSIVLIVLFAGSFYFADKAFAQSEEPILIEISDTQIGTEAFEQLIQYGNGGHAAMGALLGEAQGMETNPGIGFSIGSGGNGYRPSILIAVWTDQPFDTAAALATIKAHLNVPTNPVTTNGDCAIACDGTYQEQTPAPQSEAVVVSSPQPEPTVVSAPQPEVSSAPVQESVPVSEPAVESSTETAFLAPEQPASTPQPEQQITQDNTQQYTLPIVTYETNAASYSSSVAPSSVAASITSKPIVNKVKITPKNIKSKKVKKVLIKSKQPIK